MVGVFEFQRCMQNLGPINHLSLDRLSVRPSSERDDTAGLKRCLMLRHLPKKGVMTTLKTALTSNFDELRTHEPRTTYARFGSPPDM